MLFKLSTELHLVHVTAMLQAVLFAPYCRPPRFILSGKRHIVSRSMLGPSLMTIDKPLQVNQQRFIAA